MGVRLEDEPDRSLSINVDSILLDLDLNLLLRHFGFLASDLQKLVLKKGFIMLP